MCICPNLWILSQVANANEKQTNRLNQIEALTLSDLQQGSE